MSHTRTKKAAYGCLIAFVCFFAFATICWKIYSYTFHLSFAPRGMHVWNIVYTKEESWGFGPGGNETGVIAYTLQHSDEECLNQQGISYLTELSSKQVHMGGDSLRGLYDHWHSTPIDEKWFTATDKRESLVRPEVTGILGYLDHYGFGILIDPKIEREINQSLGETGSYYAHGRSGMIIIAPKLHRIFFVYAG